MKLVMGVVDIPYAHTQAEIKKAKRGIRKARRAPKQNQDNITTGDVAAMLEAKYHPMRVFVEIHNDDIVNDLEKGLEATLESMLMGAPVSMSPFDEACSSIEARFKAFLSNKELDALGYPGIPTKAALEGVSHRFKHPYAKRPPRPSLIDTGLYQASAAVEVQV